MREMDLQGWISPGLALSPEMVEGGNPPAALGSHVSLLVQAE
jgi:hypothetical protein